MNVAIEVWTRTTGGACGPNETRYGYLLFPWVIEGTVGDLTLENGAADFILTARTQLRLPVGCRAVHGAGVGCRGHPR